MPPWVLWARITAEAAGVESNAPLPMMQRATPLAAAMRRMMPAASRLKKRPSPPSTSVPPRKAGWLSKIACTKACR